MPTYEYRCKACGEELEVVQAFTDDALTTCPSCGAESLRKVFGAVGISFKGSGFYKTDSRGTSSSSSTTSSAAASSDAGSSGSGGKEGGSSSATPASDTASSSPSTAAS